MGIKETLKNVGKGISKLVTKKKNIVYQPETLGTILKNASE